MTALSWLGLIVIFLMVEALFTMSEMSFISFDRIRLNFLKSQGNKRAKMLAKLMEKPLFLFGSCLIGVNTALIIGSECSRQFYTALGWPVELAPITQTIIVVLFAELSPLLAARAHFQSVALFLVPIIYVMSWIFYPLLLVIDITVRFVTMLFGGKKEQVQLFLNRDELQNLIEKRASSHMDQEQLETHLVSNIFKFKQKKAKEICDPLSYFLLIPKSAKVEEALTLLEKNFTPVFLVYEGGQNNITKIGYSRDLLDKNPQSKIGDLGKAPWFIDEGNPVIDLLSQLKKESLTVCVVLAKSGKATGAILLEDILDELFGSHPLRLSRRKLSVQRTLRASMPVVEFNQRYGAKLPFDGITLGEMIAEKLGHAPKVGESIRINQLEFFVKEASLISAKTLLVRSLLD